MITRFAPSPTGYMHIGNARTALICWLYAKKRAGKFILRIDDTDIERSKDEYTEAIKEDLKWLHIDWDLCFNQLSRTHRYDEVFDSLLAKGKIYPCYETPEELDFKRSTMLKAGLPPIYKCSSTAEKGSYEGRTPYFRLKVEGDKEISWEDEVRGETVFFTKNVSDPVIRRADGSYTYIFPSTVDDIDFRITHVVRGEDHVSNTAVQKYIMSLLDAESPTFAHLPLLRTTEAKISKRLGENSLEIRKFRDSGIEPLTIGSYLSRIGTSSPVEARTDIGDLIQAFDIKLFNQAPINFFYGDLLKLNAKVLSGLSYAQVRDKLLQQGIQCSEEIWNLVSSNINSLHETRHWVDVCNGEIAPVINREDAEFLAVTRSLLPDGEFDSGTWETWFDRISKNCARSAKGILLPLRLALTGIDKGPHLSKLLPLIGRKETIRRLEFAWKEK
ncbi:glutamate--tRNA ligase [Anaplasma bovis]|uniref:glutamate--tRNA ligase n=1 Tax=Anaplasma bovis TaxID=186733 RepID=UPI002FEEE412